MALSYFTGGMYAALIESKPFLKYLVKLLDLGVEKATKETAEEAAEKGKKLDNLETGKKPTPDELAEKPAALAEAKGMAEINDALDIPVAVTIAALSSLKVRYKWIKSFEARPKPIPGHYEIHMIASDTEIDKDYSEKIKVSEIKRGPLVDDDYTPLREAFERGELEGMLRANLREKGIPENIINNIIEHENKPMTPYRYAHLVSHYEGYVNP